MHVLLVLSLQLKLPEIVALYLKIELADLQFIRCNV